MTEISADELVQKLLDQAFNELHWSEFLEIFRFLFVQSREEGVEEMTETSADGLFQKLLDQAFTELHWSEFLEDFRRCVAELAEQRKAGI